MVRKRRAGRPSRPTTAAKEAKAAGGGKRKRPTTSKPAVPPVAGQACTQCSTHVSASQLCHALDWFCSYNSLGVC